METRELFLALCPILAIGKLSFDAFRMFELQDEILRELYEKYRDLWESLGKPTGWQWQPKGEAVNYRQPKLLNSEEKNAFWLSKAPTVIERYRMQQALSQRIIRVDLPVLAVGLFVFVVLIR